MIEKENFFNEYSKKFFFQFLNFLKAQFFEYFEKLSPKRFESIRWHTQDGDSVMSQRHDVATHSMRCVNVTPYNLLRIQKKKL